MSEPLFLQSVMQEKIWGGTKLRDEFGYEIPSDKVGEYWAISAHPHGVSTIKTVALLVWAWISSMQNTESYLVTAASLFFRF